MKNILFLILALISFTSFSQLSNGLLLNCELNGNAIDASSNQLDGFVNGALGSSDHLGVSNSALIFDGVNDYVEFPNSDILKPDLPLTISFWLRIDESEACSIYMSDFIDYQYYGFWVSIAQNNQISISIGDGGTAGSSSRQTKITTNPIEVGVWQHLTFIVRSANDMDIYVNCELVDGFYNGGGGSTMVYSTNPPRLMNSIAIGPASQVFFKGALDDLMIWNRSLDANELTSFCQASILEENLLGDIVVYPNPVSKELKIKTDKTKITKISIFDSEGKMLIEKSDNLSSVNLESLNNGIYILKIEDMNSFNTYKIIKE